MKTFCKKENENNHDVTTQTINQILLSNSSEILDKFGCFQIKSILLLSLPPVGLGMLLSSFVFLNIAPPFQCKEMSKNYTDENFTAYKFGKELNNSSRNDSNQCFRYSSYNISSTFETNQSLLNFDKKRESCIDQIVFDTTHGSNAVTQFGLVCELAWRRPFSTASAMIGMFFGTLLGVRIADRFGRRSTSLFAILACVICLVTIGFSSSYWMYSVLLYLNGMTHILVYTTVYTWILEMGGSADKRVWAIFSYSVGYSVGGILMSLIAYITQDWKWILILQGIFFFVCLVLLWLFVPESPSWLLQKQRKDDAVKLLKNIIKTNKIDFDYTRTESHEEALPAEKSQELSASNTLPAALLWTNKVLRRRLLLTCLLWNVCILSFYTNSLNSANLGGDAYVNNAVGCVLEMVALVIITGVLKKHGRKSTLIASLIAFGFLFVLSPWVKQKNKTAGLCFALLGRFFGISAMMIGILFSGEIFPTTLRSTSICIGNTSARICGILSPFLIFFGEEFDLSIPFYVMGGVSFASVYLVMLLPETCNCQLLNTLEEALALKDPSFLPRCQVLIEAKSEGDGKKADRQQKIISIV